MKFVFDKEAEDLLDAAYRNDEVTIRLGSYNDALSFRARLQRYLKQILALHKQMHPELGHKFDDLVIDHFGKTLKIRKGQLDIQIGPGDNQASPQASG